MSKIGTVLAVAFVLVTGASGVQGFVSDWSQASTTGQTLCTVCVGFMGLFGVGSAVGAMYRRSWGVGVMVGWGLSLTLASGLAPVAWADAGVASGIASGVLGAGLAALTYLGIRGRLAPSP
jgi:hypothetical protein